MEKCKQCEWYIAFGEGYMCREGYELYAESCKGFDEVRENNYDDYL